MERKVSPAKFAHFVLMTRELPRLRDWYVAVLDGRVAAKDFQFMIVELLLGGALRREEA